MPERLIHSASDPTSAERLQATYASGLIAPEKKPFLIDLQRSSGPYLAVEGGGLICDAASQIATLGLGFNAGALFGTAQFLESWTNRTDTEDFQAVREAFQQLLARKLGGDRRVARFCASGTEAVETALAHFYDRRARPGARQVLAFEGSFHGRMMVALASTWNPAKRELFAWPGHESVFAPYPEMDTDAIGDPPAPANWQELWAAQSDADFERTLLAVERVSDPLLRKEVASLRAVRTHLAGGKVYAILIEPMQCEGGDRYASARFHQGLAWLATAYSVPLIYDEIQTGFGLGGEFFWHRMFELQTPDGQPYIPDAVICAKKAQTGIVLMAQNDQAAVEIPSAASVIRGYIQASVVDQFQSAIQESEARTRTHLSALVKRYPQQISRPRVKGLAFAFDLESPERLGEFVAQRFEHGLLYYPAGSKTARFRLNLGYRAAESELFWSQLEAALAATFGAASSGAHAGEIVPRDTSSYYEFHEQLLTQKRRQLDGQPSQAGSDVKTFLERSLAQSCAGNALDVVLVDGTNYAEYRTRILALQTAVYEPARQSSPEEFDALFASANPLSILVLEHDQIVGMACAGPLALFTETRGVPEDPYLHDPHVAYVLDLTVVEAYRGLLGRALKQAVTLLAQQRGVTAIHGRNRDRLAGGMWAINLSLGSYATRYLTDDYPDRERYRDCFYYRCPTTWSLPPINLSAGISAPLGAAQLDAEFIHESLPSLVNKLTLSNFVTPRYLAHLEDVAGLFPEELRHFYTANGISEVVDKIVKVLWRHRQPRTRLLTIEGHDFGGGSFLARSLSGIGDPFFSVNRLPTPSGPDEASFWSALDDDLQSGDLLAMFVEPLLSRTMQRLSEQILARIVQSCRAHHVPIVFNDTAGLFYRYTPGAFAPSAVAQLRPDASIAHLGGQMALAAVSGDLFIDEPLMLISTWDGDAFSLAQFHRAMRSVQSDTALYFETVAEYDRRLAATLAQERAVESQVTGGVGWIRGDLSDRSARLFRRTGERQWVSCPSYAEMLRFNASASDDD